MTKDIDLANCNNIKCILMLAVVVCHSCAFWGGNWFTALKPSEIIPELGILSSWLGTFHVPGFVFVSGYIYYYLRYEKGKYSDGKEFILNKAKRLLIPYLFISVIWVIPCATYYFRYSIGDILVRYALGTNPSQLWFLLMLFCLFLIIYPVSNYLSKKSTFVIIVFAALSYLMGVIVYRMTSGVFQISTYLMYVPYFLFGFMFRRNMSHYTDKKLIMISLIGLFLNISSFAFVNIYKVYEIHVHDITVLIIDLICRISGTLGVVCLMFYVFRNTSKNKLLDWLAPYSFPIYLLHQQVIYICLYTLNGFISPYALAFISFCVSVIISIAIVRILRHSSFSNVFFGYKS